MDPIRGRTSTDLLFWKLQGLMHGCLDIEVADGRPKGDGSGRLPVALRYDWPRGGLRGGKSDDEQVILIAVMLSIALFCLVLFPHILPLLNLLN
jgi:hypothetical protein